jgi:hypothetical protein
MVEAPLDGSMDALSFFRTVEPGLIRHISSFLTIKEFVPLSHSLLSGGTLMRSRWLQILVLMKKVWQRLSGIQELKWISRMGINVQDGIELGREGLIEGRIALGQVALDGDIQSCKFLIERMKSYTANGNKKTEVILVEGASAKSKKNEDSDTVKWQLLGIDAKTAYKKDEGANVVGTALIAACYKGHIAVAKYLVEQGANLHEKDSQQSSALNKASWNGHLSVVKYLIEQGAKIESMDRWGWTPLHLSCWNGHLDTVIHLTKSGANLNAINRWFRYPLHFAAYRGHLDVVKFLVGQGAKVNAVHKRETPFFDAVRAKKHDVAVYLADVNATRANKKVISTVTEAALAQKV